MFHQNYVYLSPHKKIDEERKKRGKNEEDNLVNVAFNASPRVLSEERSILFPFDDLYSSTRARCNLESTPDRRRITARSV